MSEQRVLSLRAAVLININIMLGAGIFLNTVKLAGPTGAVGGFAYIIAGALMFPLVLSIAKLTSMHPAGGFYAFGKNEIHPIAGFISAWSYLIGKLASGALMIHFSLALVQQLIPMFRYFHLLTLDFVVIGIFVLLNMLNIKAGARIQTIFTILKLIPITFAILAGIFLFQSTNISYTHRLWSGIPSILPFLFYATMGFEAACLLCNKIKNPERNAPRAILISYGITLAIASTYQLLFYGALGSVLSKFATCDAGYLYAFPLLLKKLIPNYPTIAAKMKGLLHLALASSAIGGGYGIMFSNTWNLYTLAQNGHIFFKRMFIQLNRHAIPVACVFVEGLIYATYLFVSRGSQEALQVLSSLGVVLAYTVSVIALLLAKIKRPNIRIPIWIPIFGLVNCSIFIVTSLMGLAQKGFSSLITFSVLLCSGIIMYLATKKNI